MTQLENLSDAATPERVPLKGMRKMIAAKMLESLQTTAQLTHHAECRLDALKAHRAELKAAGSAVSVQDLVLLKVIETLKAHPGLNATLADEVIHHHAAVHLGLAIPCPATCWWHRRCSTPNSSTAKSCARRARRWWKRPWPASCRSRS